MINTDLLYTLQAFPSVLAMDTFIILTRMQCTLYDHKENLKLLIAKMGAFRHFPSSHLSGKNHSAPSTLH